MKKFCMSLIALSLVTSAVFADYQAGVEYLKMGKVNEALQEFQMDVETYNSYWYYPAYMSAVCMYKLKDYSGAIEYLRMAEEPAMKSETRAIDMANIKVLEMQVLVDQKKYQDAINLAKKYIPQSPADQQGEFYYHSGFSYNKLGDSSKAINELKNALALVNKNDSKVPLINYQLGIAYVNINSLSSAIEPLLAVLKSRPKTKSCYYLLTDVYLTLSREAKDQKSKNGFYESAAQWSQKGLNYFKNDKKLMVNLGNAYLGSKQYDAAISIFEIMLGKYSNDEDVLFGLGSAYMGKKSFSQALPHLEKVKSQMKKSSLIYTYIASAYLALSKADNDKAKTQKAINVLNEGLRNASSKSAINSKMREAQGMLDGFDQNIGIIKQNIDTVRDNIDRLQGQRTKLIERIRAAEELYRKQGKYPKNYDADKDQLDKTEEDIKTETNKLRDLQRQLKEASK